MGGRMKRKRVAAGLLAALALLYGLASLVHVADPDRHFVASSVIVPSAGRLLAPGWHLIPRVISRVTTYPSRPVKLRVDLTGRNASKSSEGAKVEVEAELTYVIPPEAVLNLHRRHGPDYETKWLAALLRRETAARVTSVSYDVVRNRDPELTGGVLGNLREQASEVGLTIRALRIFPVAAVGESSGEILRASVEPLSREVVILGVDSFDWRIVDPLVRRGRMPNVARLVARGARANLRTIRPILSPVIWTSIATGVKPSRHGIADFVVTARDTGALVPVTSAMRQVPALWTLLSRQGIDVNVVGWWATWPAETVRGSVVTDRVAFQLFEESMKQDWKTVEPEKNRGKTYPPELLDEIRSLIRVPAEVGDEETAWFLPGRRLPDSLTASQRDLLNRFKTVLAAGQTYHAIALHLFKNRETRLKMIYYEGPDTTSHLFMHHRPPLLPGVNPADAALFSEVVDRYYELQDRYIGELLDRVGDEATVLLVSDHGFKSDANRPPHSDPGVEKGNAADWHTPVGIFLAAGPDIRRGFDLGSASVLDIAPTVLALYGLPVPRDGDGQPLAQALTADFLREHRVAWIDSYGGARQVSDEALARSNGDAEMIEKLRSLGYIGEDRLTAHNNRGVIALEEGDVDSAIAEFGRALDAGGAAGTMARTNLARAWLQKGDVARARTEAEKALAEDPGSKQAELILSGALINEGDLGAAERHLRRAIAIDPTFVPARSKLGEVLQRRGDDEAALAEFRKIVEIAPLSAVEYNNIGNIHRKRGEIEKAMEAYREALRCDARFIGAYNNLGLCLQEKGRLEEARALYGQALAIRPENPILRNSLGTLLALRGDKQGALAEFERAVKASPEWPVAQGNLATLLFETGHTAEATPAFERWVKLEPESVEARLGHALSLLAAQRHAEAVAEFKEVLRRDPENLRAHIALGETLLRQGDLGAAQSHLEKAAKLHPDIARIHNSLGEVYLRRGLTREAEQAFRRSLALEPGQDSVRRRLSALGG